MVQNKFYRVVAVSVCAALVLTSGDLAGAALYKSSPYPVAPSFFLRNEEKIRLETQALSLQEINSGVLLEDPKTFPFVTRLLNRSRISFGEIGEPASMRAPVFRQSLVGMGDLAAVATAAWAHQNDPMQAVFTALLYTGGLHLLNLFVFVIGVALLVVLRTTIRIIWLWYR